MAMPLLSHYFSNQNIIDVFLYFLLHPSEDAYLARIVDTTGKALIQVQRTLKRLVDCGLILKTTRHKKTYYKADRTHVAYDEIRQLTIKAKILSDEFESDLKKIKDKIDFAFVYGSVAKGSNSEQSDIDLFIVGNLTYSDISSFAFKLGRELVQEVNVTLFTTRELLKQLEAKNSYATNVVDEPKIWLFGDKDVFKKIYQ